MDTQHSGQNSGSDDAAASGATGPGEAARAEDESRYYFQWGTLSWICVALGIAFAIMISLLRHTPPTIGYIGGALIAVVGGIAFAFQPKAALNQKLRPMTPNAARKQREKRESDDDA